MTVPADLWEGTLAELHLRGAGERESGAFLLARRDDGNRSGVAVEVVAAAYYDDLDAECLTGGITMSGSAYDVLWRRCADEQLVVVADVHTHPRTWVGQSHIDSANPMMAFAGHIALIIGRFAEPEVALAQVGMYRYVGKRQWEQLETEQCLRIEPAPQPKGRGLLARWLRRWWRP